MFYFLLSLMILYCIFVIYCKIRFRFWSIQPVFHIHNLYYWFAPCGIIQHHKPPITKFYDPRIRCFTFASLPTEKKELFYRLNQGHYLQNTKTKYCPQKKNISNYFQHHNRPCFICLYFKPKMLFNYQKQYMVQHQECIASITARPLNVTIHGEKLNINYIDYLCVKKGERKKGIAPKLIYSFYVLLRDKKKTPEDKMVYLFKREGAATFITPLTVYDTYGFYKRNWKPKNNATAPVLITGTTFNNFYHFSKKINFPCKIIPALSNIKNLIIEEELFIFMLILEGKEVACYIFRDPHTLYNNNGFSIDLIASYCEQGYEQPFIEGFYHCINIMDFKYLLIENISHNYLLLKDIICKESPFFKSPTSYYFYNFAYRPFLSKDVFILN